MPSQGIIQYQPTKDYVANEFLTGQIISPSHVLLPYAILHSNIMSTYPTILWAT